MGVTKISRADRTAEAEPSPRMQPDAFFSEAQIRRLQELMQRVQDAEAPPEEVLTTEEFCELQALIKAELLASARRSATLANTSMP